MKKCSLSIFILFLLVLTACQKENNFTVAILHTNDVHGKIDNFGKLTYLKDSLLNHYDTVLLVSAGDIFSGNPYVDYHEQRGYPMIELMNQSGYDLAVLGNHEFDYGQDVLAERIEQAAFPFLAANIVTNDSILKPFPSSLNIPFRGINLHFRGLIETHNNGKPSTHPKQVVGLHFNDPLLKAEELFATKNHNEVLIALTHLGYRSDSLLAIKFPEIDLIIGGHSHTLIDSELLINNVLVTQANDNLEYTGLIELSFSANKIKAKKYKLIALDKVGGSNSEIEQQIKEFSENEYLDEELTTADYPLSNPMELGCLHTDAQRAMLHTDFAFQNYYGIRIDSLPAGKLARKDMLLMDPFNNEMMVFEMTVDEIESLLASGYHIRGNRFDLFISGGTYRIETNAKNKISSICISDENGNPLSKTKTYTVALNGYVANSYKFDHSKAGRLTGTYSANNLISFLETQKSIDYNGCNRVDVITNH
ncbi:MAG TPA: hypothetical protein DDX98_15050 [Bacteroidales bacterium]|nr:hypothetical protein [Bacteroidales bacterium]